MISLGQKFESFADVKLAIKEYEREKFTQLIIQRSRTIEAARKMGLKKFINPELKYHNIYFSCIYSGKCQSVGKGLRKVSSYRQNCGVKIYLSVSVDGQYLVVNELKEEHNHELSKVTELERKVLLEICQKYCNISQTQWARIQKEYTTRIGGESRSIKNLQICWRKIQSEGKKAVGEPGLHSRKTNNRPPLSPSRDIKEIQKAVHSVNNESDTLSQICFTYYPTTDIEIGRNEETETNGLDLEDQVVEKEHAVPKTLNSASNLKKNELMPSNFVSTSKCKEKERELNVDDSILPASKRKSKHSLEELQTQAVELTIKNEEEKLKLTELKKKHIELQIKNEKEISSYNHFKMLLAKAQYEQFLKNNQ